MIDIKWCLIYMFCQLTYMIAWITWSHEFGAEYPLSSTKEQHKWYFRVHRKYMECTVERFDRFHYWKKLQVFLELWITKAKTVTFVSHKQGFSFLIAHILAMSLHFILFCMAEGNAMVSLTSSATFNIYAWVGLWCLVYFWQSFPQVNLLFIIR